MRRQVIRAITIALISAALLSSCASSEKKESGESPDKILARAMGEGKLHPGKVSTLPGADRSDLPYVPVITPPKVVRIWVPDHVTPSNDLVVGHWIFVKLEDEKWYIEDQWADTSHLTKKRAPLPPSAGSGLLGDGQTPPAQPQVAQEPPATQQPAGQHGLMPVPAGGH